MFLHRSSPFPLHQLVFAQIAKTVATVETVGPPLVLL